MRMARRLIIGGCGLAALLLATGCGPNPKDLQIQTLQERVDALEGENADLRDRLAYTTRELNRHRDRAFGLEQQVADLRQMLAERPDDLPEGWVESAGGWRWIDLETDLLFDSGRATLKPAARAQLQKVVQDIQEHYADMMIWVVGHTDTDPIMKTRNLWNDNLDLSANRAMTVYKELQKLGLDPQRMIAGGQGEYAPRAPNTGDEGKAQNRRVQIVAVPMPGEAGSASPESAGPTRATPRAIEK